MALNPKLTLKPVASIKTFGAAYKVDTNHAWLLPIDENNRRCQAAGYSGLKDYLIKKGLKLTKWKETGLIKELVTPNGERMAFDKEFPSSQVSNTKSALKENLLLRTSSCSVKKAESLLSPKRIRSLSPNRNTTVKYVESKEKKIDSNFNISHTSINVCYTMRRSKTLSALKYDKENNAITQEKNIAPSKFRTVLSPAPGKSLTCLPKVFLRKPSEENISDSVHIPSTDNQNIVRGSLIYRKIDRKNNSSSAKNPPKLEMCVTHKHVNSANNKSSRDSNLSNSPNNKANKRSETNYRSGKIYMENKFVYVPPSENLERNADSSTTSTCISMFTARSSVGSLEDKNESVIRIDITSPDIESGSKKSPENITTTLLYVAEGCDNETEEMQSNSFSKMCVDETNEKEENSENNCTKSEVTYTSETAVEAPEYSEEISNSTPRSTEVSSDEQLSLENATISQESTQNNNKGSENDEDCSNSVLSIKECLKAHEKYLTKECENSKEIDAVCRAVATVLPVSAGITQKLHISNAISEHFIPETTALTLNCSNRNYTSLIDVRCTLKDVRCTLKDMRRNLENCSKTSQKVGDAGVTVAFSEYAVSKQSDIEAQDKELNKSEENEVMTRITDVDTLNGSCSDRKETQYDADEFENTNYNTAVTQAIDPEASHEGETFRSVLSLPRKSSKVVEKAKSFHEVPTINNDFPENIFLEIDASNSYSSVFIRRLIESPLYTQDMYKSLSSALSTNFSYQMYHPIGMKKTCLQKQHEMYKTTEPHYERNELQTEISYKDAETQTQQYFDETTYDSESKVSGACVRDDYEIVDDHGCQSSNDEAEYVNEDTPETQNLQVDINDQDDDSDDLSVYEDAFEIF